MYLVLVFLPLFGSLSAGLFGRLIGREGAKYIPTACVGSAAFLSWIALYEVGLAGSPVYIDLIPWIDSEMFSFSWGFMFDSLTVVMLCVVYIININ